MTTITFDQPTTLVLATEVRARALLRIDPPSRQELQINLGHTGTADPADFDAPEPLLIPAGKATWSVTVQFRPSFAAKETAILTIRPGAGYTVGAESSHTMTRVGGVAVGAKPTPENTGCEGALTAMSGKEVTQTGAVIENRLVTGTLRIRAANVTVRNCKINGGLYGIECETLDAPGLQILDCEFVNQTSCAIYGRNFVAERNHIHEQGGDAFKAHGNSKIRGNCVYKCGKAPGAHADGDQSLRGFGLEIVGNSFELLQGMPGYEGNSAISISANMGPCGDVLIEANWLNGGTYTVYLTNDHYGPLTNARMLNNRFGRGYQYGVLFNNTSAIIKGNVWDDDGSLMSINQ